MLDFSNYLQPDEALGVVWLLGIAGVALLIRAACRGANPIRRLARDEDGAAYSLAYVLTVPFYLVLICLVVETSSLLVVKIGTMYAAYAAARSRIVWEPVAPSVAQERMELAGKQAMTPFASSHSLHRSGSPAPSDAAQNYMNAYRNYSANVAPAQPSDAYWSNRYQHAWGATRVTLLRIVDRVDPVTRAATPMFTVEVKHDAPLIVPVIGRILGDRQVGGYWVREMRSEITLPGEAFQRTGDPKADNPTTRPLGITYEPDLRN